MNLSNFTFNESTGFSQTQFIDAYHKGLEAASQKFQVLIIASFVSFLIYFLASVYLNRKNFDKTTDKGAFFIDEPADIKYALLAERVSFVVHFAVVTYLLVVQFVPNWYLVV